MPRGLLDDSISQIGVLYTRIIIQNDVIHLFNTHLQASYVVDHLKIIQECLTLRLKQMIFVRDFINQKLD